MGPDGNNVVLETRGLVKDFGGIRAVNGVDLKIRQGTIHAIIGPNGAGKTTLFNCLSGFTKPSSGEIFFRGKEITGYPSYRISYLGITRSFQITSIFPGLSVLENVRIALQSRRKVNFHIFSSLKGLKELAEEAHEVLRLVGLEHEAHETASNLDYGSKRCLEIGIALATDPELFMFDEPTSGVGPDESRRIIDLVLNISKNKTIVLVEHNIDMVLQISNFITVLHQGAVIAEGAPDEVQKDPFVQEAYLGGYKLTTAR